MRELKPYIVGSHAELRLKERGIKRAWLEMVIAAPDERALQDGRETRLRLWRKIPQNGNRVLCVILDERADRLEVVTVFFDRRKRT